MRPLLLSTALAAFGVSKGSAKMPAEEYFRDFKHDGLTFRVPSDRQEWSKLANR